MYYDAPIILHVRANVYSQLFLARIFAECPFVLLGRVGEDRRNLPDLYFLQVSRSVSLPGSRLLSPRCEPGVANS